MQQPGVPLPTTAKRPEFTAPHGGSPLLVAARQGAHRCLGVMARNGADLANDPQLLYEAIGAGYPQCVEVILSSYPSDDAKRKVLTEPNRDGYYPVHQAVLAGECGQMIPLLHRHGANINVATDAKSRSPNATPLQLAVQISSSIAIVELVKLGADLTVVDDNGYSLLHMAASEYPSPHCVGALLQAGCQVAARHPLSGETPLHLAADPNPSSYTSGYHRSSLTLDALKVLLRNEYGDDDLGLDVRDASGLTPLQQACKKSYNDSRIKMLLRAHCGE